LHRLRVHCQLDLCTDKISTTIGLDDERTCAQLHERVPGGACHLVARKRCLVLVDEHLTLTLGERLHSAAIRERDGVEVHLGGVLGPTKVEPCHCTHITVQVDDLVEVCLDTLGEGIKPMAQGQDEQ
jgi:hypothetical protein